MNNTKFMMKAEGDFPFIFYIEKALPKEEDGQMVIEGVASTINVDHDNERMAPDSLKAMANIINEKSVPLRIEHSRDNNSVVGKVFKAWVDDRNQLWIKASLDAAHPIAPILHQSLKQGVKLGLSVGGRVKRAVKEFVESAGKVVKTFYDVVLDEVSVTQRPANYDSWLLAKSITVAGDDFDKFRNTDFYQDFLFDNQQLDYMRAFAKSIPDKSWHKVEMPDTIKSNNNSNMELKKETDTKETVDETKKVANEDTKETEAKKKEDTDTKETEFVPKSSFDALKSMVADGFQNITSFLEKMTNEALDQAQPDSKKDDPETAAKQMETPAKDDTETEKPKDVTGKAIDDEKETDETKKEEDTKTDTYELKSMSDAVKRIKRLNKQADDKKDDDTKTDMTEKSYSTSYQLEDFVKAITVAIERLDSKFEKSGTRVPGLTQMLVDVIKNDSSIQEELRKMMKEPGFKKSRAVGTPFVVSKDGKRYSLIAQEAVEKSQKPESPKSFKDLYKTEYSSFKEE